MSSDAGTNIGNEKALLGRELEWANNSSELLEAHASHNGPVVRTRFPPEPNGFLHIGHAKSINMNFKLAFEKLGVPLENRRTVFRYDDTNPDAESSDYITSLRKDLAWLGWTPEKTTYSSENFEQLCKHAITLIKKGLAYVCDMSKNEMELQRDLARRRVVARNTGKDPDVEAPIVDNLLPGRNRDTSVDRNLRLFENMRMGLYPEGSHTLRLKMDFESSNPNMFDLVAYRIKYKSHPHPPVGDKWCIYPSYDFTHGICDSIEHIDYSICTLEFETRREPYFWILWALDLFRPKVYEMSRLNLAYTVLSKRRLLKLVEKKVVRGWNDPRMPTISGLRRKGYSAQILNSFCDDVGATRASNVVEVEKLNQSARLFLAPKATRCMAALDPLLVQILNWEDIATNVNTFQVQNSPTDESLGTHDITFTKNIYIDKSDFRMVDEAQYYGLAPNKAVGLKYIGAILFCKDVLLDTNKNVLSLQCIIQTLETTNKPKTWITWVPENGISCEVRVYNNLFTVPEPTDLWEEEINPISEVIHKDAIVDPSVAEICDRKYVKEWESNVAVQFERMGYFVVDIDSVYSSSNVVGKLVFNRTVSLKEEVYKKKISAQEAAQIKARKENDQRAKLAKEARLKIDPKDLFRLGSEYQGKYSKYNEKGIPTHMADGKDVTKSAMKKLEKEQVKHIKQLKKAQLSKKS